MNDNLSIDYFVHKECPPSWRLDNRSLDCNNITFVLKGSSLFTSNKGTFNVTESNAICISEKGKRFASTKGMECVAISFRGDNINFPIEFDSVIHFNNDPILLGYISEMENAYTQKDEIGQIKCVGLLNLIMARLAEIEQLVNESKYVSQIKKYISCNLSKQLTVKDIASNIGLSPIYTGNLFKQQTGQTIIEYINKLRVGKACSMLSFGNIPLIQISSQCGFNDINYFSRVFRKNMNCSPKKYQQQKNK